jgi:hypothetical protein
VSVSERCLPSSRAHPFFRFGRSLRRHDRDGCTAISLNNGLHLALDAHIVSGTPRESLLGTGSKDRVDWLAAPTTFKARTRFFRVMATLHGDILPWPSSVSPLLRRLPKTGAVRRWPVHLDGLSPRLFTARFLRYVFTLTFNHDLTLIHLISIQRTHPAAFPTPSPGFFPLPLRRVARNVGTLRPLSTHLQVSLLLRLSLPQYQAQAPTCSGSSRSST